MKRIAIFLLLYIVLIGCTKSVIQHNFTETTSEEVEVQAFPEASAAKVTDGINDLAVDLYRELVSEEANIIYSPYSIALALSMVYSGSDGETATEFAEHLHFLPQNEHSASMSELQNSLDALHREDLPLEQINGDSVLFDINIANSFWVQEGYQLRKTYIEDLNRHYGADTKIVDFIANSVQVETDINKWIEEQTAGRIDGSFANELISPNARILLLNTTFFKGSWAHPFKESETNESSFYISSNSTVSVPMMHGKVRATYTENDVYQAIGLPYASQNVEMLIVLPKPGNFESFEQQFDTNILDEFERIAAVRDITLIMPKFELKNQFNVVEVLRAMGLVAPFSLEQADFDGIAPEPNDLYVSNVLHQASISVDENGTEAAAATGIAISVSELEPVTLVINRPFIYAVRERETGLVLFLGRVMNPSLE